MRGGKEKTENSGELTDFHRLTFNYPLLFFRSADLSDCSTFVYFVSPAFGLMGTETKTRKKKEQNILSCILLPTLPDLHESRLLDPLLSPTFFFGAVVVSWMLLLLPAVFLIIFFL